jgi:hypothetical protein
MKQSCNGIEMQLRVDPGAAWLTIKRPGCERAYRDIPDEFQAIGEDVDRFEAFVNAAEELKK